MTFRELGLNDTILNVLQKENYHTPTPIQSQTIPHALAGKDVLGIAQTGTGKTHTIHGIVSMICETKKRILVCTPSNSAIDEIVLRLGGTAKFQTH